MRTLFVSLLVAQITFAQAQTIHSPSHKLALRFALNAAGEPTYQLSHGKKTVLTPSRLGILLKDQAGFDKGFTVAGIDSSRHDDTWAPVWGEVKQIRNHYQELAVTLRQAGAQNRRLVLRFRLFDDGLGFRYEFPAQKSLNYFTVSDELTEFNLPADHTAFWIPGDYDTNEYAYTRSRLSAVDNRPVVEAGKSIAVRDAPDAQAVATPLMLKADDGLYVNIHEAAQVNYPAMQLHVDRATHHLKAQLVPDAVGTKAYLQAPAHTPWRTLVVSDKATDIIASKLILNLNEPSKIADTGWIKPMKFVGVWWEMQIGTGTWSYADRTDTLDAKGQLIPHGRHAANTQNVKRYIDFAAKHGIQGVLVEGWNTGWEDWFGNWKEEVFDFVTPYPDFNVTNIQQYAKSKGVSMIMHNETSGSVTNYERRLEAAYDFMNKHDYPAVKTGYVGRIIPRGEHHDGQWMSNHYVHVAQVAANHRVMVDMHEPVRPTGLHRTYPNWLACEAARGNEFNAFDPAGNPPEHETILPFTRLMGGPMDYTPGIFKLKNHVPGHPERQMHTTLTKQLALYVTLYSPLQMAADLPENYEPHLDAFQFIKDVPVDWDDTRVLLAEPGDYLAIARQAKGKDEWYLGAITDEQARNQEVKLDFLKLGQQYEATIYADGKGASWDKNPEAYQIRKQKVSSKTTLKLQLAAGGGTAISIKPLR
ncbi:glycoside hydrolase family 97 protein [Hymenobacter sp. ASUV-10]|uniref:Glycoside hydrolase family 97 protein n=1 Tax=Hymenobacter aranciens TaxID=3063996 RepID=A0ABT9BIG6_9BACT|nr:glycoside hydrolase family 97 protein [Hymenobacter sp. ASUV-10]MDO7877463.1 glycoside hydrolase family 97 protein [Hymenobacter sp. ASUV-10]